MKKKARLPWLFVLLFVLLFVACGNPAQTTIVQTEEILVELTDRQKSILQAEDLPTELNQLTDSQRSAIISIEEMLSYLETKYKRSFFYLEYIPSGMLEEEQLECYSDELLPGNVITLTRTFENGEYIYKDDYLAVQQVPEYEMALSEAIKSFLPETSFCLVSLLSEPESEQEAEDFILQKWISYSRIFISGNDCSLDEMNRISRKVCDKLHEENLKMQAEIEFCLLSEQAWLNLNRINYMDVLDEYGTLGNHSFRITGNSVIDLSAKITD